MSLETQIETLNSNFERLIALLERQQAWPAKTPKAKVEKAPPAEQIPDRAVNPTPASPAPSVPAPDYEPVRQAVLAYNIKHGRASTLEQLKEFGVTSGKDLKPEQWGSVLKKFTDLNGAA
jgi:hypothetical protein